MEEQAEYKTANLRKTLLIAGFPGVGKSTFCANADSSLSISDSDSSQFAKDANWPQNYLDHIEQQIGVRDYVLISTHKEVLDALIARKWPFALVRPHRELKPFYLQRYLDRNSPPTFIDSMCRNWSRYMDDLDQFAKSQYCFHVELTNPNWHLIDTKEMIDATLGEFVGNFPLAYVYRLYNQKEIAEVYSLGIAAFLRALNNIDDIQKSLISTEGQLSEMVRVFGSISQKLHIHTKQRAGWRSTMGRKCSSGLAKIAALSALAARLVREVPREARQANTLDDAILVELQRLHQKWGLQRKTTREWTTILLEEFGECAKEMNDRAEGYQARLAVEFEQCAVVCIAAIEDLQRTILEETELEKEANQHRAAGLTD